MAEYYSIATVSGASYGFAKSGDYYVSQNKGVQSSAAVCQVNFELPIAAEVTFHCINYAESSFDYGILSNIDETLSTSYTADTNYYHSFKSKQYSYEQDVVYNMEQGSHFIYVKFRKDISTDSYNDTLQFRISISFKNLFYKENGIWKPFQNIYKKINGVWVEIEKPFTQNIFNTDNKYGRQYTFPVINNIELPVIQLNTISEWESKGNLNDFTNGTEVRF